MKIYLFFENDICYGWSEHRNMDSEIEIDVDESHPIFSNDPRLFVYANNELTLDQQKQLDRVKAIKLQELNNACNDAILGRFSAQVNGVSYWFSHDKEAQDNFEMADKNLNNGRITSIPWTCYESETSTDALRITFDKDTFEPVYVAHANVMPTNVSKLRDDLEPKVKAIQITTTVDDAVSQVNAIVWS